MNRRAWTSEEIEYIKESFDIKNYKELSWELNRTIAAIKTKCNRLGMKKKEAAKLKNWDSEEVSYLKEKWKVKELKYIANKLKRTEESVRAKASYLNLGHGKSSTWWSEKDENCLIEKWGMLTVEKLAQRLKRTEDAVRRKAYKLGLGRIEEASDYITLYDIVIAFSKSKNIDCYTSIY